MTFRFLIFSFCLLLPMPSFAAGEMMSSSSAKQAYIVDAETGQVLFQKSAEQKMPTSSMSKVVTTYMIFQALEDGRIDLDTEFEISEKAWRMGGSKMFIEVGKKVKVEDLLRGVIIQSGNDAAVALAEGLAGNEGEFAIAATRKAHDIGMKDSNFVNASGWPDEDHYSTAKDLTVLARHLITDFPKYYDYYAETEFTYNNIKQSNRNPLLYRKMGVDGIKTGHTEAGGYGLMASGTRDDRRVVMVLNGMKDEKERAQESARLMEWALRSFENVELFAAGEKVEDAEVSMGAQATVPLMVEEGVKVTIPRMARNDLSVSVTYEGPVIAPVKKGQQLGTLKVTIPRMDSYEYPLVAGEDVDSLGLFAATIEKAKILAGISPSAK